MGQLNDIFFCASSDLGQKRTNNEDAFIAQNIWDCNNVLAVAIDGVGGYEGGEIAAAIAKESIVEYLESFPNGERVNLLKQAIVEANNNIFKSRAESEYKNMSCVLTAILVEAKKGLIHMAHIGDTRLYQYHQGEIKKLSHDHSLVGYREEIGELTEEDAMHHPQRNIIGRDMGSKYMEMDTDQVEMATFKLKSNSILLLCSDGLSDMITSSMISSILSSPITLEEKVKRLIDKANVEGGKDNITVVLVEYTGDEFISQEDSVNNHDCVKEVNQQPCDIEFPIVKSKGKELSQIRSLLKVVIFLLLSVLFGMGFLAYQIYKISDANESSSMYQIENIVWDVDSLLQLVDSLENE